jgi:tRNA A-37 threonylcarbamoyl transferase component Bud32
MSEEELRANLCTADWRGKEFKTAALDELLRRQRESLEARISDIWETVEDVACGTSLTCPTCNRRMPCNCEHQKS